MEKLVSLHKHWVNADALKQVIAVKIEGGSNLPPSALDNAQMWSSFCRLSVFYGLIYVVVEGYRELKYSSKSIDELLDKTEFVDALRLFRNAIFHYQKVPIPEKALKLLELKESEEWIGQLHLSFKKFFEEQLPLKEILSQLDT